MSTQTYLIIGLVAVAAIGTIVSALVSSGSRVVAPTRSDTAAGLDFAGTVVETVGSVFSDIL